MDSNQNYYAISTAKKSLYASTFLLLNIARNQLNLPHPLLGANKLLKLEVETLLERQFITHLQGKYQILKPGEEKSEAFQRRYSDILKYLDIFSFVDLQNGEFAFEKFGTFDSDQKWKNYCSDQRWSDLRIAMIDYLEGDASELVFSQLTLEGIFNTEEFSWQQNLARGKWWREIQDICNDAIQEEDLGYSQESGKVSGEQVLEDIFEQGSSMIKSFYPHDIEINSHLESWYGDHSGSHRYGATTPISSKSRPPWETPWAL